VSNASSVVMPGASSAFGALTSAAATPKSDPPALSHSTLHTALSDPDLSPSRALRLLSTHLPELLKLLTSPDALQPPAPVTCTFRFRPSAVSTAAHPTPSAAETAHASAIAQHLGTSVSDASLLLRDFLGDDEASLRVLASASADRFSVVAPLQSIERFATAERRAGFACLVQLFTLGGHAGPARFSAALSPLVDANANTISTPVCELVCSFIEVSASSGAKAVRRASSADNMWVLELFMAVVHSEGLSSLLLLRVVTTLVNSTATATKNRYLTQRHVIGYASQRALLDGASSSLLLCSSICSILLAAAPPAMFEEDARGDDIGSSLPRSLRKAAGPFLDTETANAIDLILCGAPQTMYAEVSIVRMVWGAVVASSMPDLEPDLSRIDSSRHAQYAASFGSIRAVSAMIELFPSSAIHPAVEGSMRVVFWASLHAHYLGFPPASFPRSKIDIEDDIQLAVAILDCSNSARVAEVAAAQLWQNEYSDAAMWVGSNALLRLSSALFPVRFLPFISLLTVLCVDQDSAMEVLSSLGERIYTRTESPAEYESAIRELSDVEVEGARMEAAKRLNPTLSHFFETVCMVSFGSGNGSTRLVTTRSEVESPYTDTLPVDTIALWEGDRSSLTWACHWNGWEAVALALRSLLVLSQSHPHGTPYSDEGISELVAAVLKALRLVERVFYNVSSEMREQVARSTVSLELVCDLFLVAAGPPDQEASWMTSSIRATLLTATSACLYTMTSGSAVNANAVLGHLAASHARTSSLQICVNALGSACFPALSAISGIARNALSGSAGIMTAADTDITSTSCSSALSVLKFMQRIGLPLWLSLLEVGVRTTEKRGPESPRWLLPAMTLDLFVRYPEGLLNSSAATSAVAIVLTASVDEGSSPTVSESDFLFPAVFNAVALCIAALQSRISCSDDFLDAGSGGMSGTPELSAFEKMLLRHDVVHALAVLASGTIPSVRLAVLSQRPQESGFEALCQLPGTRREQVELLEDMAAQCLSLFMTCLFKVSQKGGEQIPQVPWPSLGHSSPGHWLGGGDVIRRGFAKRIENGRTSAVADFVTTVVSCGQRAVARALLGPASGKPKQSQAEANNMTAIDAKMDSEILAAVLSRLGSSVESWMQTCSTINEASDVDDTTRLTCGQNVVSIASCVRLLRAAWEVHGGVWLKEAWVALDVWKQLADLLRCGSGSVGSQSGMFDIGAALKEGFGGSTGDDVVSQENWTKEQIRHAMKTADAQSYWRLILSDIFGIFTSEVVFRSSEMSQPLPSSEIQNNGIVPGPTNAAGSLPDVSTVIDTVEQQLRIVIFDDPAFAALREVFTEQWMYLLLTSEHVDVIRNNTLPGGTHDTQDESLEEMTQNVSGELDRLMKSRSGTPGVVQSFADANSILFLFRRKGETRPLYGANYAFSMEDVECKLRSAGVSDSQIWNALGRVALLNSRWSRADVQLTVVKAFSSLTTMIVMADSVAPSPNKMLTYASPQYCGKLCRVITHVLAVEQLGAATSPTMACVDVELAMLLGFVSARLSQEELDQAALSAVRFNTAMTIMHGRNDRGGADVSLMSPVAKLSLLVNQNTNILRARTLSIKAQGHRVNIVQWLLLSGARLAPGPAFRNDRDVSGLGDAAMSSLRACASFPEICSAAAVVLSAVVLMSDLVLQSSFGREDAVTGLFGAMASLAGLNRIQGDEHVSAAASLVLFMTKMSSGLAGAGGAMLLDVSSLQHLSNGSIAAMLPPTSSLVPAYSIHNLRREPVHRLLCASLSLSASLIAQIEPRSDPAAPSNGRLDEMLQYANSNAGRITGVNLDLSGDWPPLSDRRHLTMARVEEAELAMQTAFALAGHAIDLRDAYPAMTHDLLSTCCRVTFQIYRLIRAEPMEQWVRPVSEEERERSESFAFGRDSAAGIYGSAHAMGGVGSPWAQSSAMSPSGGAGSGPSPRRTPQQAFKAALGFGGRGASTPSHIPPSPGMPTTPQFQSPMSVANATARSAGPSGAGYQSPLSPWSSTGGGLITGSGFVFAEEVARSVLRTLASTLGALRRFSSSLELPVFAATMKLQERTPSVGILCAILYHACTETQRGAEGERRDALMLIIDNALHLVLAHAAMYVKGADLTPELRDEMHKKIETVVSRMRRVVPPPPSYSIVHSRDIDSFMAFFKTYKLFEKPESTS
jgi:hypothetical protein